MPQASRQPIARTRRRLSCAAVLTYAAFLLSACGGNYLNENDTLRRRVLELETQNTQLAQRVDGLETQLKIEQRAEGLDLPEGVHPPRTVALHLDAYTGPIDKNRDGKPDHLRFYVIPRDADQRFVPTLGELSISVVATPAGGAAQTLVRKTFDIKTFHAAYRSGLTGSHYTLDVPIDPATVPEGVEQLSLKASLHDALTGHRHEAGRMIPWQKN